MDTRAASTPLNRWIEAQTAAVMIDVCVDAPDVLTSRTALSAPARPDRIVERDAVAVQTTVVTQILLPVTPSRESQQ